MELDLEEQNRALRNTRQTLLTRNVEQQQQIDKLQDELDEIKQKSKMSKGSVRRISIIDDEIIKIIDDLEIVHRKIMTKPTNSANPDAPSTSNNDLADLAESYKKLRSDYDDLQLKFQQFGSFDLKINTLIDDMSELHENFIEKHNAEKNTLLNINQESRKKVNQLQEENERLKSEIRSLKNEKEPHFEPVGIVKQVHSESYYSIKNHHNIGYPKHEQ
eukprot:NODE_141_length_15967_cov_0.946118.p8 type:complete len:218 gc:universal NODE_141_length_15967_cov_0.946118:13087-12434(-)